MATLTAGCTAKQTAGNSPAEAAGEISSGTANASPPATTFHPRTWVDFYHGEEMPWDTSIDLTLDEFPGITFTWTPDKVLAADEQETKTLFDGAPVWNVYLADLNGDSLPEFCATVSYGSGMVDTRIVVYDYAAAQTHVLADRMAYDYELSLENEQLVVTQTESYASGRQEKVRSTGSIFILNGELVTIGIDRRTMPSIPSMPSMPPTATAPPQDAAQTRYEGFYQIILKLYEMDVALNGEIRYIAVDLSGVMEMDREPLTELLTPWAESQGCELRLDTYDGLVASGHIDPSIEGGFTDGILISFDNAAFHVDGNYLTAQATKYRGPLGAVFVDFTARYSDGEWTVEEPESIIMASIQDEKTYSLL